MRNLWHKIFLITFFLFIVLNGKCINNDSLERIITTTENEQIKAESYLIIAEYYSRINSDSTRFFSDKSLKIGQELGDNLTIAKSLILIGRSYSASGDYFKALEYFQEARIKLETINDLESLIILYRNIGIAYSSLQDYPMAIDYYHKSASIAQKIEDDNQLSITFNNIGVLYTRWNYLDSSLFYLNKALFIDKKNNYELNQSYRFTNLGLVYEKKDDQNTALSYYIKALNLKKKFDDKKGQAIVNNNIGTIYLSQKKYKEAEVYCKNAIEIVKETGFYLSVRKIHKNLSDIYLASNQHLKALEEYKTYKHLNDSVLNSEKHKKILELEAFYQTEQKDKEIAEQKLKLSEQELELIQQTTLRNNTIYLSLIFLLIAITIYQWYIRQQKKKKQLAEQKLQKEQEINKLRTNFLENIAHEIRTPLTLINGHLALALEKTDGDNVVAKNIKAAINSSDKVLSNANEILELLKLEKGKLPIRNSEIQLESFLKRVFYSFESLAEIKKIDLEYISNLKENIAINSDENRLEKILNNFIANAIKFSPSNSKIIFNVISSNTNLTISVTDFGPGIAFDEQTKIFNRFYQAKTANNIGGVGVGLSLAKEFAESLDGSISVTSEPNKGATFILTLPVTIFNSTKTPLEEKSSLKTTFQPVNINIKEKSKILIIEDNPEMSAYLSEILSVQFECDVAFNGIEGLQKIQTKKYSLIISDVMMPQMDGFELKQKINLITNYKNVPFIFITAKAQLSDRIVGYNLGVDDYITKPFVKEELLARVKMLLVNKKERENWIKENLDFIDNNDSVEEQLLTKLKTIILNNLSEENFKVTDLANEVAYSQRQLTRLLKKATGLSPVQFILEIRLQKAYFCLTEKKFSTLAEVRNYVGIPSSSHFNKKFIERFGIKPSEITTSNS